MYDLGCMFVESRPFVVLDGLPDLYGLKYDSATAYGLLLYLCSYKLDGSATAAVVVLHGWLFCAGVARSSACGQAKSGVAGLHCGRGGWALA